MADLRTYLAQQGWYQALSREKYPLLTRISPTLSTKARWKQGYGRALDLENPRYLADKQAWLKLNVYNKSPLVKRLAHKVLVRDYVTSCGCGDYLIEQYGVWDRVEDIDFTALPNQFVMKTAMGCGGHVFCRDKAQLDVVAARETMKRSFYSKDWLPYGEMQYKPDRFVKQQILAERMLDLPEGVFPSDFKFHCYEGRPEHMTYCYDRTAGGHAKFIRMGMDWQPRNDLYPRGAGVYTDVPEKPDCFEEMVEIAKVLSKPFPFVRVDFYVEHGRPRFGELTFTPTGGMDHDYTDAMDIKLGDLIDLANINYKALELQ